MTTLSSREFAQDLDDAKRAATAGPVLVTESGKPTHALLKIEDYYALAGKPGSLLEVMNSLPAGDFDFEIPKLEITGFHEFDLTETA